MRRKYEIEKVKMKMLTVHYLFGLENSDKAGLV